MTKNKIFTEIKLAMRAGHYRNLTHQEKQIYKNAFKNGYKLARLHIKKDKKPYQPRRIVGYSFAIVKKKEIDNMIEVVSKKYEISKLELLGKKRTLDVVRTRNIIHNILSEKYKMNLSNIGRYFGQDHTTVLHSIKMKYNKERYWDTNQTIWQEFQELKKVL
jgi:hypothetical protein|tara:strand:- start:832 stop:1317 length:486 start_codon:yes stop_codon:yes gene_type:complete